MSVYLVDKEEGKMKTKLEVNLAFDQAEADFTKAVIAIQLANANLQLAEAAMRKAQADMRKARATYQEKKGEGQ